MTPKAPLLLFCDNVRIVVTTCVNSPGINRFHVYNDEEHIVV